MSESNSDNKDVIEETVAKKPKATKKPADKKEKAVVAKSESDVVKKSKATKKEPAKEEAVVTEVKTDSEDTAPYLAAKQAETESGHFGEYMAAAAAVVLIVTLSIVTFYDKEFESLVASFTSTDTVAEVAVQATDDAVFETEAGHIANINAPVSDQIAQPVAAASSYGYQPFATNQPRNMSFEEMRKQQRAAYEESMRKHNERVAQSNQLRTASFERMDQNRINMQKKMETMRVKTQQIQLEMQQKMQAAYNEFHAI